MGSSESTMTNDDDVDHEEHEVTLSSHEDYLQEIVENESPRKKHVKRLLGQRDKVKIQREPASQTAKVLDVAVDPVITEKKTKRVVIPEQYLAPAPTPPAPRPRRSRFCLCSTFIFMAGIGVGCLILWQAWNPFATVQDTSSNTAGAAEEDSNEEGPSMMPTDIPTTSPQPTLPWPSMVPTETRKPSGSMLPSHSPSTSPMPTEIISMSPTLMPSVLPSEARICNGLASNCFRHANEIMYATVHNAMSSQEDGFVGFNNLRSMEDAMVAGFRGFLIDSCDCGEDDGVLLCHSVCVAGTRDPTIVFESLVTFLRANPWEVIILELQVTDWSLWRLWGKTTSDFTALMYTHTGRDDPWPTLNELIDMGQRIIVFQHDGGNCRAEGECPPGVQDMFIHGFETTWDLNGVEDVLDFEYSCQVSRGKATYPFMLMNHFATNRVGLPSRGIASQINTADVLQARLDACTNILGHRTTLLAVDFWSIGDTVEVVHKNNAQNNAIDNIFLN